MKLFNLFLTSFLIASQSWAGLPPTSTKGQSDTAAQTTFNVQVPNNTKTSLGGVTALIETGNTNLLVNPSFEHSTATTGWTFGSGSVGAVETTTIHPGSGKQSLKVTMTSVNGDSLYQDVTPSGSLQGTNIAHTVWVNGNSVSNLQFCQRLAGSTNTSNCSSIPVDSIWHPMLVLAAGPSSGSIGWAIRTTGSTSGSYYVDEGYLGDGTKFIGYGVPNNVFNLKVATNCTSTPCTITSQNAAWFTSITRNSAGNYTVNFTSNFFPIAPVCHVFPNNGTNALGPSNGGSVQTSTTGLTFVVGNTTTGAATDAGFDITCTRTGTDFVHPTITAGNWNYPRTAYTPIFTGVGTPTNVECYHSRENEYLNLDCKATAGTVAATEVRVSLPGSLITQTWSQGLKAVGEYYRGSSTGFHGGAVLVSSASSYVTFSDPGVFSGATVTPLATTTGIVSTGESFHFIARIPIQGWTTTLNAPQLLGSVTSNATSALRFEGANVNNTNGSGAVISSTSPFISFASCGGTGNCSFTLSGFSASPYCLCNSTGVNAISCVPTITTQTALTIATFGTTGALTNEPAVKVMCIGPR